MTDGFTLTHGIQLASLFFVGISALLGVWWKMELRMRSVEREASKEIGRIEKDLAAFKVHVVERYASWETVDRANKRLEDRIESMAADVSKMPDIVVERIMRYMDLKKNQ